MSSPSISIIIPAHNEAIYLKKSIRNLVKELQQNHLNEAEILLIENGSTDGTKDVCQELMDQFPALVSLVTLPNASYGQAIKQGILKATRDVVVIFNVDFWSVRFLMDALRLMPPAHVVVASKTLMMSRDHRPFIRRWTTYFFNSILRLIFNFHGTDTHGIKVISRLMATKFVTKCRAKNELLDTELILRLSRAKAIYIELPIDVKEVRPSRYNNWRRIYNTVVDLITVFGTKFYDVSFHGR